MSDQPPSPHAALAPVPPHDPVVLVDDDEALRTALLTILTRAGFTVHATADGEQAIRYIEKNPVSLVITDLIMPQVEGIELIVRLRKMKPDLKIIAVSGGGRLRPETFLDAAKSLGAWRIMNKPFSTPQMIATIREGLGQPPAA